MADGIYPRFLANLMNKEIDLESDTIKVMLLNNSHSFNASHNVLADVSANQITGTGYTAGGETLSNKSVTQGLSTKFDADNISWTSAGFTAYHAVLYDDTLANKDLIISIDFGGAKVVADSGTFLLSWNADGIISLNGAT